MSATIDKHYYHMPQRIDKQGATILFKEWYQSLDKQRNLHTIAREIILDACTIDIHTFYAWLDGHQEIPQGSQHIINQVAGERIFHTYSPDILIPMALKNIWNNSAKN